jgi:hypothetical protein
VESSFALDENSRCFDAAAMSEARGSVLKEPSVISAHDQIRKQREVLLPSRAAIGHARCPGGPVARMASIAEATTA